MQEFDVKIFIYMSLMLCMVSSAIASDITIRKGAGKTTIDLSGIQLSQDGAARDYRDTLKTSLDRSGWLMSGAPGQSEYRVSGQAQFDGTNLRVQLQLADTVRTRVLLSKSYSATTENVRRIAFEAADEIVMAITGKRGYATSRLVLVGSRTKSKELYLADSIGFDSSSRGFFQITNDKSISIAPRWGHDGKSIFYTSYLRKFPAIVKIDLNNMTRSSIARYSGVNVSGAVSPDGRDMALILSRDGNPELYVLNLGSSKLTRITTTPRAVEATPAWSPDGRQIVYVSDGSGTPHLYIVSREGGAPRQLTTRGRQNSSPDWGPHGEIAYASSIGGKFQIFTINPAGGEPRQITSDPSSDHEDPSWAPNGRHLAIAKTTGYKSQLYLVDTMGDQPILLSNMPGDWFSPKWSR
jgi:TolB protein